MGPEHLWAAWNVVMASDNGTDDRPRLIVVVPHVNGKNVASILHIEESNECSTVKAFDRTVRRPQAVRYSPFID